MEAASHPDIECLRRIRSLSQFNDRQLLDLAQKLDIETAPQNHCLVERGCSEQFSLYLIDGSLTATSADGKQNRFVSNSSSELLPIAKLRPSMYQVVADSPVSFLRIYTHQLNEFARQLESDSDDIEVIEFEQTHKENAFTIQLFEELISGKLQLPSLPSVAQRIQQAFFEAEVNAELIADIIQSDPVITARLIMIANSALYRGQSQIDSLQQAVVRLGLEITRKQVMTYAVKHLFESKIPGMKKRMQRVWKHSQKVACLSRLLAQHSGRFDPEQAQLAGLVHNLGEVAILQFVQQSEALDVDPDLLMDSVKILRPQITGVLLNQWHFGPEFITVAEESEEWFRNPADEADLCDLVLIAQYHAFIGTEAIRHLPPVPTLPAFAKLGMGNLGPKEIIDFLQQSRSEIEIIEAQLAII